jgi:hypothetical protein
MYYPFVRPEPTQGRIVRKLSGDAAEITHKVFNRHADKRLCQQIDCVTNKSVASAKSERDSCAQEVLLAL